MVKRSFMRLSRSTLWIALAWVLFVGTYAAFSLILPRGEHLTAIGDSLQCLVPLFANSGLLLNANSTNWRRKTFWMLLALGCTFWMGGQLLWTYWEIYRSQSIPNPFVGDIVFFLHVVPMIAALALRPHAEHSDTDVRFGYLDFTLLVLWWVYLYLFIVIPWQYVVPDEALYGHSFNQLYTLENAIFLFGLGALFLRTSGRWRFVYANLLGAACLYTFASESINVAIDIGLGHQSAGFFGPYYTGSLYDVPLVASFVWFGTAGILAYRTQPSTTTADVAGPAALSTSSSQFATVWPARLAMAALLSLPLMAIWSQLWSSAPAPVRTFRVLVTLVAAVPLGFLVFLRQRLVDADRLRLLRDSQESIDNLKRLQTQFVQSEKLASLGQLAAGAAHEINNPLTAILGYSDLLADDASAGEKSRRLAEKIREQARRTRNLVNSLLSFARQVPAERSLLDVNTVVTNAIQLRSLDLRGKNMNIDLQTASVLPGVRGDPNQLLQVFFNIISNAVDSMETVGGGVLTVRTLRDRTVVVIEFSDTGPGIKEPHLVFDPFYTTKPVGKGTGLGLSICYGVLREHGGNISCYNRREGGAVFRLELPAVLALFPTASPQSAGVLRDAVPVIPASSPDLNPASSEPASPAEPSPIPPFVRPS